MALFNSTVRPAKQSADLGVLRGKLLNSVFPGVAQNPNPVASGPVAPVNDRAFAMRAPTENHQSAASRAAYAVQQHLIANPVKPTATPVKSTRENSQLTQSAGTINTNYVKSAAVQGFTNVTPPNIYAGMRPGTQIPENANPLGLFTPGSVYGGSGPTHNREFFRNQVFTPPTPLPQSPMNLFAPSTPPASAILAQPLAPQVGTPVAQFPPRGQFLNYLFPRLA